MFNTPASKEVINKTITALKANNIESYLAADREDAVAKVKELIPTGSQVMTMTSITLETLGIPALLNESGEYNSVRAEFAKLDPKVDGAKMRALGSAPEYAIGSVHAVTEDGKLVIASNTGSQLPAYAYGAGHVVFVVGTQKIVIDEATALKRLHEYTLPLESVRANKAYNITSGSEIKKMLIINKEITPNRITVVFVPENIGF